MAEPTTHPAAAAPHRAVGLLLVVLWGVLFLPNLRTNPGWYGDEGEWVEMSRALSHGNLSIGPVRYDFVFPYPYPPLYPLLTGAMLRVFGNDVVVARAAMTVMALAAAGILYWIGCRLRDWRFGMLCALAFLVYDETVMHFRWARSHPLAGTFALASAGFLIRYVQEKRLRDIVWAGAMCALATATNYFTYPLIGAVILTALVVNWRHAFVAAATAGAYGVAFVLWYVLAQPGGWDQLMTQVGRLTSVASNEIRPTFFGEVGRFVENVWTLGFKTPTHGPPPGWTGKDKWLMIATIGFVFLPARNWRLRLWLPLWLLVLMYGVFKKLNNVPLFFYPATIFLPLMAIGFAGTLTWAGEGLARLIRGKNPEVLRWAPAAVVLAVFGMQSTMGAWGRFHSKIDLWMQSSVAEAEVAMRYVNEHTGPGDFVVVPKQIYWLVREARRSMLSHCWSYEGHTNDMWGVPIPRELHTFDCRWQNAKYVVLAAGVDPQTRQARGIDLVYTFGLSGMKDIVSQMVAEKWPVVHAGGQGVAYLPVGPNATVPVVVGGEYLVLANPRLVK